MRLILPALALLALVGCQRTEEAKALVMERQAVQAALELNAESAEHREVVNSLLTSALTLSAPVLAGLEAGEAVSVHTTVEGAKAHPQAFAAAAAAQAKAAEDAVENRSWLWGFIAKAAQWVDVAAQSALGVSLGLGGLATGGGAMAMLWRSRKVLGAALAHATSFGDRAAETLERAGLPAEVGEEWSRAKAKLAKAQDAVGVRKTIEKARTVG